MVLGRKKKDRERDSRERRQRSRNLAMLAVLGGLAVLFYVITIVKMSGTNG
jgi:hypothetical protein